MTTKTATSDTATASAATAADQNPTASTGAPPKRKRAKRKKKRAGKKAAAAKSAATKKVVVKRKKAKGRPKGGGPNKSKAIRDYLATHKNAGPTEVAAALKQDGIDVTPAFVSNIKSKSKLRRSKRKVKRGRPVGSGKSSGDSFSMSALLEAKKLAEQVGGIDNAAEAVAALKRLL